MYTLFLAEFSRYRRWAFFLLLVQLGFWAFIARLGPLLSVGAGIRAASFLAVVLCALVFGFMQMRLHRRKNDWTYLIQRPIALRQIYLALAGAGLACLAIAVPTAWLIMVAGLDLLSNTVVDSRHYYHGIFAFFAGSCAYLAGSLIALSASRGTVLIIGSLTLVVTDISANTRLTLLIAIALIALLMYLNACAFKADPKVHFEKTAEIVFLSVPMQFGIAFVLLLLTSVFYHLPRFFIGNHPDNHPVAGAYNYLWSLDEKDRAAYLLKGSEGNGQQALIRQAQLADHVRLSHSLDRLPKRGQLHFLDDQISFVDSDRNTHWTFSHDLMLLQGNHTVSGAIQGFIGRRGFLDAADTISDNDQFATVPFLIADRFLQTPQRLYELDFEDRLLSVKFAVPGTDKLIQKPIFEEHFVALDGIENIYLFDSQDFAETQLMVSPEYTITHPPIYRDSAVIEMYRNVDGYLAVYHASQLQGFDTPGAKVIYAPLDGPAEILQDIVFPYRVHPAVIEHFDFAVSPVLNTSKQAIFRAINPDDRRFSTLAESVSAAMPASVLVTAILLTFASVFGIVFLARRIDLDRSRTVLWTLMALLLGLPALLSFGLMNRWHKQHV